MTAPANIVWTPAPGLLFERSETDTDIAYHISAAVIAAPPPGGAGGGAGGGTPPPVVTIEGYSVSISPAQSILDVTTDSSGISVSADALAGLFPIDYIEYRTGDVISRVHDWDSLPTSAEHLIAFKPGNESTRAYTLTASAHLSDETVAQAQYTMAIHHNWSAGRQRLAVEIDARR